MYALTIGKAVCDTLSTPTVWRRVYRWEDKWGFLRGDVWNAETRTHVASDGENYLLETVVPYPTNAPPPVVDDMWEEEVHMMPYGTWGNVRVIYGTLSEIKRICSSNNVSLPRAITSYVDVTPHKETKADKETVGNTGASIRDNSRGMRGASRGNSRGGMLSNSRGGMLGNSRGGMLGNSRGGMLSNSRGGMLSNSRGNSHGMRSAIRDGERKAPNVCLIVDT